MSIGQKRIRTLAEEMWSDKCPLWIIESVIGYKLPDNAVIGRREDVINSTMLYLLPMRDEELLNLYAKVLYYTRYKKAKEKARKKKAKALAKARQKAKVKAKKPEEPWFPDCFDNYSDYLEYMLGVWF